MVSAVTNLTQTQQNFILFAILCMGIAIILVLEELNTSVYYRPGCPGCDNAKRQAAIEAQQKKGADPDRSQDQREEPGAEDQAPPSEDEP